MLDFCRALEPKVTEVDNAHLMHLISHIFFCMLSNHGKVTDHYIL